MRIMAVSDKVLEKLYTSQVSYRYPNIDLLLGCGDLPFYYLEFLTSALDTRVFYVRGNHDKGPKYTLEGQVLEQVQGGVDLHGRTYMHNNVIFGGIEGSMRYRPNAPFMYNEAEMRNILISMLPALLFNKIRYGRFIDILITHSPPFGIHDRSDLPHTGFRNFLPFLRYFKPKVMLHGHIHIYRNDTIWQSQYLQTVVTNVYPYHIFDFPIPEK